MLDFRPPVTEDRKWVAPIISHAKRFGCDYSFGDMFIWQHVYNIRIASHDGFLFSINGTDDDNGVKRPTYGFPVGEGNLKEAIELIEEDSAKRGYGLEMFGLNNECVKKVETLFPASSILNRSETVLIIYTSPKILLICPVRSSTAREIISPHLCAKMSGAMSQ